MSFFLAASSRQALARSARPSAAGATASAVLATPSHKIATAAPAAAQAAATAAARRAAFSTTVRRPSGGHGSHYDPPGGWLFGVKPGEKYKNEGWEKPFFWGFCGSLIVFACLLPFKPDTSIQTWALEEARRRLEAEGILQDPFPSNKQ